MGLNAGVMQFTDGRIRAAVGGALAGFNGGSPIDTDGNLMVTAGLTPPVPPGPPMALTSGNLFGQPTGGSVLGNTVTQTAAGTDMSVISTSPLPSSGLYYWEIVVTKVTNPSPDGAGIGKAKPIKTTGNKGAGGRGNSTLDLIAPGVTAATQVNWGGPGVLMFAYDATTGKLWMGKDGTWFSSGDPAAGTNPYFSNIPADTYYIGVEAAAGAAAGTYTLQSAEDGTAYAAPAGFSYLSEFNAAVNADFVYSLKRVVAGYNGPCLRVRRSSDNTTQDIYFDPTGNIDSVQVLAFCGVSIGRVEAWFNQKAQSGAPAFFLSGANTGRMPQICDAGAMLDGLRFTGVNAGDWDYMEVPGAGGWALNSYSKLAFVSNLEVTFAAIDKIVAEVSPGTSPFSFMYSIAYNGGANRWQGLTSGASAATSNVVTQWTLDGGGYRGRGWRFDSRAAAASGAAAMFTPTEKLAQFSAVLTGTLPNNDFSGQENYIGARFDGPYGGGNKGFKSLYLKRGTTLANIWSDAQMIKATAFAENEVVPTDDPYISLVTLMLHMEGTNGSTSFVDSSYLAHTVTSVNGAAHTTTLPLMGTASLLTNGTNQYLSLTGSNDYKAGTGSFTWDVEARFAALPVNSSVSIVSDSETDGFNGQAIQFRNDGGLGNRLRVYLDATTFYDFAWSPVVDTTYKIAVSRIVTSLRAFVDGAQIGTTQTSSVNILWGGTGPLTVGRTGSFSSGYFNGRIDEVRYTKGRGRYSGPYTPFTTPFPS